MKKILRALWRLLKSARDLLKAIGVFVAAFLSIVVMYILLVGIEQGIDVVIHAGEYPERGILAVVAIVIWAYLLWYSCRTLSYVKQDRDDRLYIDNYALYGTPTGYYRHLPRFLAYHCFVCVQVAIFSLPTVYALPFFWVSVAIVGHSVLYALLTLYYENRRSRSYGIICVLIVVLYLGFLIIEVFRCGSELGMRVFSDGPDRHEFWLRFMCLFLFALQILSVRYFAWRRQQIDRAVAARPDLQYFQPIQGLADDSTSKQDWKQRAAAWFQHPKYSAPEKKYFRIFNYVSLVGAILYLAVVFFIPFATYMGPLALAILAVSILAGLANLIKVVSLRARFSMFLGLLAMAFLVGLVFRDPYRVRLIKDGDRAHFIDRPTPRAYMTRWFDQRLKMIASIDKYREQRDTFDVYIVLSNGGASRAGKWTTSILGSLQDISRSRDPYDKFSDHVLAIAGASGGTVGNCAFYSLLKAEHDRDPSFPDSSCYLAHTNRFFRSDFLTFTLGRFLGPDIIRHLVPIDMDDRAASLARLITHSRDTLLSRYFGKKLTEVFDYSGDLPMLFITSTKVDDGMPGLISSVQLPRKSQRNDILSIIDHLPGSERGSNMTLATAAILSSRFPYVSPAGKVGDNYYVDGGYFDNSGAGTILELLGELSKLFEDNPQYAGKFSFHILHNSNAQIFSKPSGTIHPINNDLFSPILTLAGMQGASTSISTGTLTQSFMLFSNDTVHAVIDYNLYDKTFPVDTAKNVYEEGYPMSWVISDYQINRMDSALRNAHAYMLKDFYFYRPEEDTIKPARHRPCCKW